MNYQPLPCRGPHCNAKIYWLILNGKLHPFDDPDRKRSHFATCPDANQFRKPKEKKGAVEASREDNRT